MCLDLSEEVSEELKSDQLEVNSIELVLFFFLQLRT